MSQFTLSLIRQLQTLFGPDADVGFREQGYLIMARRSGPSRCWPRMFALQRSHGADIALMEAPRLARQFPLARD